MFVFLGVARTRENVVVIFYKFFICFVAKLSTGDEALKTLVALAFFAILFPHLFLPFPHLFLPFPHLFLLLSPPIFAFIPTYEEMRGDMRLNPLFNVYQYIATYFILHFPT